VWLVAAGGVLALAFPRIMGLALSGFYLVLFLVLWSLLLRGISIEVRGHINEPLWQAFWDFMFAVSNILMAVLPGVAIGNLLRGVPLDGSGEFSLALFSDFNVHGKTGLLDWYTVSVGLFSAIMLSAHGATYLALKTEGGVHDRSVGLSRRLWTAALLSFPLVSWMTWYVRRDFYSTLTTSPAGWFAILALLAGAALLAAGKSPEGRRFAGSCCVVIALTAGAVAALFPAVLRSTLSEAYSVSMYQQAGDGPSLFIGLLWWSVAFGLALVYMLFIARNYRGKVKPAQDTQGFY
jgi:cytochrome d ubiquinol oxidase subunit II